MCWTKWMHIKTNLSTNETHDVPGPNKTKSFLKNDHYSEL